jgi:hypothetical protein
MAEPVTPLDSFPLVDHVLVPFARRVGRDFAGYRHHVHRALNHFAALARAAPSVPVQLAAAFHDLGMWTDRTFDYLQPSARLAQIYLVEQGLEEHAAEVRTLILEHHKLRPYRGAFADTVELYRQADLVDLSCGAIRFGLDRRHLEAVQHRFPDAGFHWMLVRRCCGHALRHPLRPLPMMHW